MSEKVDAGMDDDKNKKNEGNEENENGGFESELDQTLKLARNEKILAGSQIMEKMADEKNSGDTTKTQQSSASRKTTSVSSESFSIGGADGMKLDDWQIETIAERVSQKIYDENRRREVGWEGMLSRAMDEIGETMKRSIEIAKKEICDKINQKVGEYNEKPCEMCKNIKEREITIREKYRADKRKWDNEKEKLLDRCMKAEEKIRMSEMKKKTENQPRFDNASYVTKEVTNELARGATSGAFEDRERFGFRKEWVNERPESRWEIDGPRKLSEEELRDEHKRRKEKKYNVYITHKCKSNAEALAILEDKMKVDLDNKKQIKAIKGQVLINMVDKETFCWKIAGMKDYAELNNIIEDYDIVSLLETWVEEKNKKAILEKMSEKKVWYTKVAERKKQSKNGRASGGHMIGIKKELSEDWKVVEWDYGFKLINKKESEMLVTVYNNVGMDAIEKKIKKEVREMENIIEKIIVLGDMNARIGESDVTKIFNASEKQRKSKDKKLNAEGIKLLSLCEELVLELKRKNNFNVGVEENKDKCKGLRKLEEERLVWKKDNVMDYAEAAYEEWQRRRENNDELQWNDINNSLAEEMECEEIIKMIYDRKETEEIEEKIKTGLECYRAKLREVEVEKINKSRYNELYKEILLEEGSEYWNEKEISGGMKEVWARFRCGNLTRAGKAGMEE
ncbi:hypothetical protein KQX54_005348 [Cotesia glomerata]|uniref:Uncharacterized protein n=1 Tax=Cotesia glomerata TaxID=32391 RepID=A0AAV7IJ89_COTGL|nr:hypothetical protein KQX54_005348 [Cotesia glomerata]